MTNFTVNRIFFSSAIDQTTRKYTYQAFAICHLAHYKIELPRTAFSQRNTRNQTLVSAILNLPVTLVLLTGVHASKRRNSRVFTIHGIYRKKVIITIQKKSEKPLDVCKRVIDPLRGEPPQDQSKNRISK